MARRRWVAILAATWVVGGVCAAAAYALPADAATPRVAHAAAEAAAHGESSADPFAQLTVFILATFIGLGVILRVSRLLHTPLMSLTNAISAIAVVGSILVTGTDHPIGIRVLGAIALFASMTNIVSGFLITDRMVRMFKETREEKKP